MSTATTADRGAAFVIIMLVLLVMTGLTGAVASLTMTQTAVAANHRRALELLYAAEGGLDLLVHDLGGRGAWDLARRGRPIAPRWFSDPRVSMIDGTMLDLTRVVMALPPSSALPPAAWRFLGQTQLRTAVPSAAWGEPQVVAAWMAELPTSSEAGSGRDDHPRAVVQVAAFGSGGAQRAIRATVRRRVDGRLDVTSWRVVR